MIPAKRRVVALWYTWTNKDVATDKHPCLIFNVAPHPKQTVHDQHLIRVLPISHSPPRQDQRALELPRGEKLRLHLDSQKQWVYVNEGAMFSLPGDTAQIGHPPRTWLGEMSETFFGLVMTEVISHYSHGRFTFTDQSGK